MRWSSSGGAAGGSAGVLLEALLEFCWSSAGGSAGVLLEALLEFCWRLCWSSSGVLALFNYLFQFNPVKNRKKAINIFPQKDSCLRHMNS